MSSTALILVYCTVIVAGSCLGGWLPSVVRLTHRQMQLMISFVGGLMLGVALFHLLPHAVERISLDHAIGWLTGGLLLMFFLARAFHFHQHEPLAGPGTAGSGHAASDHAGGGHHGRDEPDHKTQRATVRHAWSWLGIAVGLGLHTAIDGVALAADVVSQADGPTTVGLAGLGTFLAVLLHKPLDALSITSLMTAAGWSRRWRQAVNIGFALMCPIGALLFASGFAAESNAIGGALALAAGVFLCISLSDLLPEVQFHQHDRVKLSIALLLGLAVAFAIHFTEPHPHGAGHSGLPQHDHHVEPSH